MIDADATPLETALRAIDKIMDRSESDPSEMRKMLVEIRDLSQQALFDYNENVTDAVNAMAKR
jgi:hypothetical protein